jgi:hypothetical protein
MPCLHPSPAIALPSSFPCALTCPPTCSPMSPPILRSQLWCLSRCRVACSGHMSPLTLDGPMTAPPPPMLSAASTSSSGSGGSGSGTGGVTSPSAASTVTVPASAAATSAVLARLTAAAVCHGGSPVSASESPSGHGGSDGSGSRLPPRPPSSLVAGKGTSPKTGADVVTRAMDSRVERFRPSPIKTCSPDADAESNRRAGHGRSGSVDDPEVLYEAQLLTPHCVPFCLSVVTLSPESGSFSYPLLSRSLACLVSRSLCGSFSFSLILAVAHRCLRQHRERLFASLSRVIVVGFQLSAGPKCRSLRFDSCPHCGTAFTGCDEWRTLRALTATSEKRHSLGDRNRIPFSFR